MFVKLLLLSSFCCGVIQANTTQIHLGVKAYDECKYLEPEEKEACLERNAQSLSKLPWWAWLILVVVLVIILLVVIRMLYVNFTEGDKIEERRRERKRKREKIMQGCGWTKRKDSDGNQAYRSTRDQTPKKDRTIKCTHLLPNGCTHEAPYSQNTPPTLGVEPLYKSSNLPPYVPAPAVQNGIKSHNTYQNEEQEYPEIQQYQFRESDEHIEMYELPSNKQTPQNQIHLYKSENMASSNKNTPNNHRNFQHISNQYNKGIELGSPLTNHNHPHQPTNNDYEGVQVIYGHPADLGGHSVAPQEPTHVIYGHPADLGEQNGARVIYGHPSDLGGDQTGGRVIYGHPGDLENSQENGDEVPYAQCRKKERTSVYV